MDEALLDSDILSELLKAKNQKVLDAAQKYLTVHLRFSFSSTTLYEIVRGFEATRAVQGLAKFNAVANRSDVFPVTIPVLLRAAKLWADASRGGYPRGDADLIIAATALESGKELVT